MSEAFYKKPLSGLMLLAGAVGGPYMLFETDVGKQAAGGMSQLVGGSTVAEASSGSYSAGSIGSDSAGSPSLTDPSGYMMNPASVEHDMHQPAIHTLQEVLRFDIAPGWVLERFPRVSTVLADTQLDGLRVPLVTGTAPSDIAGTLTYSFDRYKRLQRVVVQGMTGDATRFMSELQQQYQMQQVPSLGGVLYLLSWNGKATSIVHIEPAAVIYADSPYARFKVLIELNQAGLEYGLSREAQQLLDAGKRTQRW
ncbi:MAG: DUF6690 family protein [Pirellulaceae bacterium]